MKKKNQEIVFKAEFKTYYPKEYKNIEEHFKDNLLKKGYVFILRKKEEVIEMSAKVAKINTSLKNRIIIQKQIEDIKPEFKSYHVQPIKS